MVPLFFFLLIKKIYSFLQFWLCWISVAVWAFLYLQQVWAALHCGAEASHCCGFSYCAAPSLGHMGFIFVAHGLSSCRCQALEHWLNSGDARQLSCSMTWGIFPDQGLNLCFLHWQADSLPLSHQGSPMWFLFYVFSCRSFLVSFINVSTLIFL